MPPRRVLQAIECAFAGQRFASQKTVGENSRTLPVRSAMTPITIRIFNAHLLEDRREIAVPQPKGTALVLGIWQFKTWHMAI
jgi:hypothetical protein